MLTFKRPYIYLLERVKPCFFVTFNIILSHIFLENFIEILEVVQKIWRISLSILTIFINFLDFWHLFVTEKLVMSAYNKRCQHCLTFNLLSKSPVLLGLIVSRTSGHGRFKTRELNELVFNDFIKIFYSLSFFAISWTSGKRENVVNIRHLFDSSYFQERKVQQFHLIFNFVKKTCLR